MNLTRWKPSAPVLHLMSGCLIAVPLATQQIDMATIARWKSANPPCETTPALAGDYEPFEAKEKTHSTANVADECAAKAAQRQADDTITPRAVSGDALPRARPLSS